MPSLCEDAHRRNTMAAKLLQLSNTVGLDKGLAKTNTHDYVIKQVLKDL
jgi:hypothetical protein